jgi:beta-galactosidase
MFNYMKRKFYLQSCLLFLLLICTEHVSAQINDHMFPAAAAAKPFIDFDSKGFLINGKRTFIVSANMEYARVPRQLWRDRLIRLKRAGFNAIETYTFWNYHEPKEGQFSFSGDQDLDAFLKLIRDLGMYSIVRVGPYYCGEWNLGGYPIWLKFKPGLRVREDNPQFISAVDKFFEKLIPIVTSNQINHGGSVILVQLENEHKAGWGTDMPNAYFKHLLDKTTALGLQVPHYFSGMHPGNDPASNKSNLDDPKRPNPWFSAEYWGVWFYNYGPQPQDSTIYDRRTWKIIAHGGNAYNVYMAHGGTNFDYNNSWDVGTSYDYGAAVGQTGDLRPIYYSYKRAAWFARSFQEILENSRDASEDYKSITGDTSFVVTARSSPAGNIVFLDNPRTEPVLANIKAPENIKLPLLEQIKLAPGEIMPIVNNFDIIKGVKLLWAPTRIYAIAEQGNTKTLILYGEPGSPALLYFNVAPQTAIIKGYEHFRALPGGNLEFSSQIPSSTPEEFTFELNGQRVRVITVNNQMAQRTWFVEADNQNNIVIGPEYAAETTMKDNRLNLTTEQPWLNSAKFPVWVYKSTGDVSELTQSSLPDKRITELKLSSWEIKNASEPVLPAYNDLKWKLSATPAQMGADGDLSANAWYRTKIKVPQSGRYTLQFQNVRERAAIFLDGKRIDSGKLVDKAIDLNLKAGILHNLTVFTAHTGRAKQIYYLGVLDSIDAKGITGAVTLKKANGSVPTIRVGPWRMKGGPGDPDSTTGWKSLSSEDKKNSPQFFRTTFNLPDLSGTHPIWRVITTSLSSGSVWVNGHNLGRYPERIRINGLYIPESWLRAESNTLVIYDENGANPDKVSVQAEIAASRDETIFSESVR